MSLLPFGIFDIVNEILVELARRHNAELISSARLRGETDLAQR